jgi:hypothetical protein
MLPECLQCQRAKKPCPGMYHGLFIIQAVRNSKSASTYSLPAAKPTEPEDTRIAFSYQPSLYLFKQNFLLNYFISSFRGSISRDAQQGSWMTYLFDYISDSGTVTYAIRATTLALYGTENQDMGILQEADHWNLLALQAQRVSITRNTVNSEAHSHIPSIEEICTTLMLLYYELIRPSTTGSWLRHLQGFSQMVFLLGPQHCQSGALHLFLRALRLLMVRLFPLSSYPLLNKHRLKKYLDLTSDL